MNVSDPIPVEQATAVDRPDSGPWTWADPIGAIVSDSYKWRSFGGYDTEWGPAENRIAQSAIENLYRCGYALVKVLPQDGGK